MATRRPSWPYPIILAVYLLLVLITPSAGAHLTLPLFFAVVTWSTWAALSPRQYRQLQEKYPELSRADYVTNMLVFPVLLPLLLVLLLLIWGGQ